MPDIADLVLRLVGAFYVFAGIVAARAALTSRLIDVALERISMRMGPASERHLSTWLVLSAALVFAGGLALLLGLDEARWLFLVSAAGQAIYLFVLAPFYFDKAEPPDARGRRQTANAFVIYVAATALVWWAAATGKLIPLAAAPPWQLAAGAGGLVAYLGFLGRHMPGGMR